MTADEEQPYRRIVNSVQEMIRHGKLRPNEKLPSTRELVAQYGVAPGTVQRALAELRSLGAIYSHQGRGSYVRERPSNGEPQDDLLDAIRATQEQISDLAEQIGELANRVDVLERERPGHRTAPN